LPHYPNERVRRLVTVRELLNMQSGIGDFFGPEYAATPKDRIRTLSDYLPLFASKPLLFAPGTDRRYSNGGYIVLGLIIERVSGQSYYDYVKANIFGPAGMTASGWFDRDIPAANVASGYTRHVADDDTSNGDLRNNIYTAPARGSSAGGGYSNALDLVRLAAALQGGKLLNTADASRFAGGLGVAGGSEGINADLEVDAQSGYVLVVLSNYDPPAAEDVAKTIRKWLGLADINGSTGGAHRTSATAQPDSRRRRRP
jgi:D-alanyl-D-alanine carboxypeptidase